MTGPDWIYYAKKMLVIARQMTEPFEVKTLEGTMKGQSGDYWVRNADDLSGPGWPVKKEIFEKTYWMAHSLEIHEWIEQENRMY
ncbi:MAG: hypothetical protein AUJ07_08640 [Crenarchaeota archaeon 13_1_40CM_3_53_5]|nr:MAG: hypothetical protein AUJ07_08640 [Crenarchaeota archaeon 13_1_40CM_3_53_5]